MANEIKREIMVGELESGSVLLELELASRFQCGQSTIREALLLLQEEGMVQRSGYRGTRVSDISSREAIEMLLLRRDIECRAAQQAFNYGGDPLPDLHAYLAKMRAAATADDEYALAESDRDFHLRLLAQARLPSLEPLLLRCLVHTHRFKMLRGRGFRDLHQTAERHVPIIEAVEQRAIPELMAALAQHAMTIFDGVPLLPDDEIVTPLIPRPATEPSRTRGQRSRPATAAERA